MNRMENRPPSRRSRFYGWTLALGLASAALASVCGCVDHRVGLGEFLVIERAHFASRQLTVEQQPAPDLDTKVGAFKLGPDDVIAVYLTGADGAPLFPVPVRARLDREGSAELPVIGALKLNGLELRDAEDTIRRSYVPRVYTEAVCHVELIDANTANVIVRGAVTMPGLVALRRTERNLLYAIVGAGGASELASGKVTLRRIRRPAEEVTLDLTDPVQLAAALSLDPLQDGDMVFANAATPNTVFVGGLVNRVGPQAYPPGTGVTVLQALAGASGLRTDVFPKDGTLIRRMPDGTDVHVRLDLNRLASGQDPNIELVAGDILWVPETWETRVQDFINRNVFFRAGVSVNYNVTGIDFLNRRSLQSRRAGGGTLQDTYDPLGFLTPNTLFDVQP